MSWLQWAARAGYAACGIIYLAIGAIAAAGALGLTDSPGDAQGALVLMERLPLGDLIVAALGVGLLGYATLNIVGAIRDREQRQGFAGLVMRAADALTGALYLALAVVAVRIATAPNRQGGPLVERWAADIMRLPGGQFLLGAIGLSLVVSGVFLLHRARTELFADTFDRRTLTVATRQFIVFAARYGTITRGLILAIMGLLAVLSALSGQADQVGDAGDALSAIKTTPAGRVALGVVALGFMAYGVYQLAKVRHRRVPIR